MGNTAKSTLSVNGNDYEIYRLDSVKGADDLPFSLKILLENLLRHHDGVNVTDEDIQAMANWDPKATPSTEIAFTPARVLMQDFTGVPAVVDLAAMREAMKTLGGDPDKINPLQPAELVIDHSVQIDSFGNKDAVTKNSEMEYQRNEERYSFLKWGQSAFSNFKVVPPDMGIVHQINLEYLARVVFDAENKGVRQAYPDTLVGTDSHTTMINGVGVLGWGVGGIEAEAAMLGQPVSMLIPQVVGFNLTGQLPEGATATDLVLKIVQLLREHGVVGKFVEFFGEGLDHLSLADRATIANMAPEYGATCGIFPIDNETLNYLRLSGRSEEHITLTEAYMREQGMFRDSNNVTKRFSSTVEFDISTTEPALSGPKRPQDRIPLTQSKPMFQDALKAMKDERSLTSKAVNTTINGEDVTLDDGAVVIASITSCTNTSNPSVMLAAGLVAQKASALGLKVKPWVKTSLAPGSRVVTEYFNQAGLMGSMENLGFHVIGYGCATCIGNSGPLPAPVSKAIAEGDLFACSVLSGNRNFEGRVHAEVRMNYLASPPLVVAYAIAGTMNIDIYNESLGKDNKGNDVFLKDIWPTHQEVQTVVAKSVTRDDFTQSYNEVYKGDQQWIDLKAPAGQLFDWKDDSTYIKNPPYFDGITMQPDTVSDIQNARVLAMLGDSVTTDHISPAGAIKADSPAGIYLKAKGVADKDFNSLGSRRGNHEVMMRGTFANIRLRNLLAPGTEGGITQHQPSGEQMSIFDAAMQYKEEGTPLIILAGKEYGSGSSRDWAAKGPRLLGIQAVIAESYERIHRTNLVCMGILPLQYNDGDTAESLKLTGKESISINGLGDGSNKIVEVVATAENGDTVIFNTKVRIDTPQEIEYYRHGGILHYVLRQLAS
ncbi:Aconitate hydratase [hydrothermal vent metagenome]|uniref:aconitate hydratase n=1 Tax=hydrothermal vent metagenome TaxID=652676 RepID=A0A3B1A7K6_9ZZZZ